MKKPMLLSVMLIAMATFAYGQNSYTMWESVYLKPKTESLKVLGSNMKAHSDKFHSMAPYKASVWNVITGPRTGGMIWFMGPCTYTDLDNRPAGTAHDDDWRENVMVYISEMKDGGYWRLKDGFYSQPENFVPKVMVVRYIDVKRGKWDEFEKLMTPIMKVYEQNKFGHSMALYENDFNDGSGRDVAIVWQYSNYGYLDQDLEFSKKYESIFGDNSWNDFMEAFMDYTESVEDEMMEYMPELSSNQD